MNNKGFALIAAFIIMVVLAALGIFAASLLSTGLHISLDNIPHMQVLYITDAGLQHVKYKLRNDSDYKESGYTTPETGSIGEGSFTVGVTEDSEVFTMVSTGTIGTTKRQITESMYVTSGVLTRGLHADGSTMDFEDSAGTINGNVSCHVAVKNVGVDLTINGDLTESYPRVTPTLDYDYYKDLAIADGQYTTSALTFANGTYTGVWYTTQSVDIGDNTVINGTIVAQGGIEFDGKADNITIQEVSNRPILVSQANISSSDTGPPASRIGIQNSTLNGMIYAGNNITFDYLKNTTFNGTIISSNNITVRYGTGIEINYDIDIFIPPTPGFTHTDTGGSASAITQNDWVETSSGG